MTAGEGGHAEPWSPNCPQHAPGAGRLVVYSPGRFVRKSGPAANCPDRCDQGAHPSGLQLLVITVLNSRLDSSGVVSPQALPPREASSNELPARPRFGDQKMINKVNEN